MDSSSIRRVSLEQRLQVVEDRFAINDLLVRYAILLDDRRFEEVGMLFTDDGVFSSPNSRTVGRAAIIENFRVKHEGFVATWHDPHASLAHIVDAEHAQGTVIGYAELAGPDHAITTSIRYQDDYRRVDGRWFFASRHVLSLYGMTNHEWVDGATGITDRKRWPGRPVGPAELPDVDQRFPGYLGQL